MRKEATAPAPKPQLCVEQAQTLVWIGPRDRFEFIEPLEYCLDHAPQIAFRHNAEDLFARPVNGACHLVFVRTERREPPRVLAQLAEQYQDARMWCLVGSQCEGERRTGRPWLDSQPIYWHQWNQWLPNLYPPTHPVDTDGRRWNVGLVTHQCSESAPYFEQWSAEGHQVTLIQQCSRYTPRHLEVLVWDESAAPRCSEKDWQSRLRQAEATVMHGHGRSAQTANKSIRHVWCVSFPRPRDWRSARNSGVSVLLSKPATRVELTSLLRTNRDTSN